MVKILKYIRFFFPLNEKDKFSILSNIGIYKRFINNNFNKHISYSISMELSRKIENRVKKTLKDIKLSKNDRILVALFCLLF